ncbi:MAG: hypothetical protein ACXVJ7_16655 [Acidimicrobiia bacterium]
MRGALWLAVGMAVIATVTAFVHLPGHGSTADAPHPDAGLEPGSPTAGPAVLAAGLEDAVSPR